MSQERMKEEQRKEIPVLRNNWFFRFCCILFALGVFLIFYVNIRYVVQNNSAKDGRVVLAALVTAAVIAGVLFGIRFRRTGSGRVRVKSGRKKELEREKWAVFLILAASAVFRIMYIILIHETPRMDFQRYYDVAKMLIDGVSPSSVYYNYGQTYEGFLSVFPFTMGYSVALSVVFRLFGISWMAAELFNVFCTTLSGFFVYRIVKLIGNGRAAVAALALVSVWPSMFFYSNMISAESCFTMLLLLAAWIILTAFSQWKNGKIRAWVFLVEMILSGIILGLDAEIRAMAVLLLISGILVLIFGIRPHRRDIIVTLAAIVLLAGSYSGVKSYADSQNREWIGPRTAQGSAAGGYNFLVGMNLRTNGGFSRGDLNYLFEGLSETGSGTKAQERCREAALERVKSMSAKDMWDLFLAKYDRIWRTDDYGASWNMILLEADKTLTEEGNSIWTHAGYFSTFWYLVMAAFSGILSIQMIFQKDINLSVIFVILTLGCAATHTLLESQNRYHYYVLYCFAILAALFLFENSNRGSGTYLTPVRRIFRRD